MEFSKKHADGIVITNPPFSKKVQFLNILKETKLDFILILPRLTIEHPYLFSLLVNDSLYFGKRILNFHNELNIKEVDALWISNLKIKPWFKEVEPVYSIANNVEEYKKYDNYDAINVNKTKNIPNDYYGEIGVPVSYAVNHNTKLFKVLKLFRKTKHEWSLGINPLIDNKTIFTRIIIKRK